MRLSFAYCLVAIASAALAVAVPADAAQPAAAPRTVSTPVQGGMISSQGFIGSSKISKNPDIEGLKDPFGMNIPPTYNKHKETVPQFKHPQAECSCPPANCPADHMNNIEDCKSAHAWACYRKSSGVCARPELKVSKS
jgi:hypothetical protein